MINDNAVTILYTGFAPVHFVCFKPIYDRLVEHPGVALFVSGGLKKKRAEDGHTYYDGPALFKPFGIAEERILTVADIQARKFDALFSANTKILAPPMNFKTRVQIFHGLSFRNRAIRAENLAYNLFFMIGPYMQRKFVEMSLLLENDPRVVPIGFPKTDCLLNGELDRSQLLAAHGFKGDRPVLLYAPTGERFNSLETMGAEVIERLSQNGRYDLLIKPHDHPKNKEIDWFAELAPLEGPHTRVVRDLNVIPLLFLADLLITDASSVANEYTLLNRPIVFLDVPELFQVTREKFSLLDLETWGRRGGVVVERPDAVVQAVAQSLAEPDRHAEVRSAMAGDFFYHPGRATEAAVAWLETRLLK